MIDVQNFRMVSTNPIPLYYALLFCVRTLVVYIKASVIYPSQNTTCMKLTTLYQVLVYGSFSLVDARKHALRCSAFIPGGPPVLHGQIFLTVDAIFSTSGVRPQCLPFVLIFE